MKYLYLLICCVHFETFAQTTHRVELVADICPGYQTNPVGVGVCSSYPSFITEFDSLLFFNTRIINNSTVYESIYKYDGVNNPDSLIPPYPCMGKANLIIDDYLYYVGCKSVDYKMGLYKWDGKNTPVLLIDLPETPSDSWLKKLDGKLFISYGTTQDGVIIKYDMATGKQDTIFHKQAVNPIILRNKLYFLTNIDYYVFLYCYDPATNIVKQCVALDKYQSRYNYIPANSDLKILEAENDIYYTGVMDDEVIQLNKYNETTGTSEQLTHIHGERGRNNWPWLAYNKGKLYLLIDSIGNGNVLFSYDVKSKEMKGLYNDLKFLQNFYFPVIYHDKIIFNSQTPDRQLSFYDIKEDYVSPIPNPDSAKSFYISTLYNSTIIYKDALYISGSSDNKGIELYKYYDVDPPSPPAKKGLYPNPVTNKCWLELDNPVNQILELKITDMMGKTVMRNWLGTQNSGPVKIEIATQQLSAGIYYCVLMAPGGALWEGKLVKL